MKHINNTKALSLLQACKVTAVDIRKVINDSVNNSVWEIDVLMLDNGQAIGLEGEGNAICYWLIEPQDFKESS
jgi:hypothetical protein